MRSRWSAGAMALAVICAAGCSSADSTGTASYPGAGGGAALGSGGSTGLGGSSPNGGASGAGGVSSNGGAGGAVLGMITATAACDAYLDGYCGFLQRCEVGALLDNFGSVEGCRTAMRPSCLDQFIAPGATVSPADTQACTAQLQASSCASLSTFSACRSRGTLANGAACLYDSQCQTGICKGSTSFVNQCGVCAEQTPAGGACVLNAECGPGMKCGSGADTRNMCIAVVAKGQACDPSRYECAFPYQCRGGICTDAAKLGETCNAVQEACDFSQDIECLPETGICTQIVRVADGQACDPSKAIICSGRSACTNGVCAAPTDPCAKCVTPAACIGGACVNVLAADCHG